MQLNHAGTPWSGAEERKKSMKKFAFLGAVSAIALICSPVLAGGPGGGTDVEIDIEDVQVPVATGGSTAAAADVEVDDSLNGNKVNSFNDTTNTTINTTANQDNDKSYTATNNDMLSNNTTLHQHQ